MAEKTCSDCIHKEVCENCYSYLDQEDNTKYITCHHFKGRADVVEVVRCKDCKWYQESNLLAPNKFCFRLEHPTEDRKIGYNYAPYDFCSYGDKRSEGK